MKGIKIIIFLLFILLFSCETRSGQEIYVDAVKSIDGGLHRRKEVDNYVFDIQFKPLALKVLEENKGQITKGDLLKEIKKQEGMQYYDLRLGLLKTDSDVLRHNIANQGEYQQRVYYYSYLFQNEIYIEQNGKKLPCVLYHFERSFNLKNTISILLAFEDPSKEKGSATLVIDSSLLGTGPIKMKFNKNNIPVLEL